MAPTLPGGKLDLFAPDDAANRPMPAWDASDPLRKLGRALLTQGALSAQQLGAMDAEVQETIRDAVEFARAAPYPPVEAALADVYA